MKKRILSILLAVVMIVGMIPLGTMTAFAAEQLNASDFSSIMTLKGVKLTKVEQLNGPGWSVGYAYGHRCIVSETGNYQDVNNDIALTFTSQYNFTLSLSYVASLGKKENQCYFQILDQSSTELASASNGETGKYEQTFSAGTYTLILRNHWHDWVNERKTYIYDFSAIADMQLDGIGQKDEPFYISSPADMEFVADQVNSGKDDFAGTYFKVTADIVSKNGENDYTGVTTAIGTKEHPFNGYFDGDGHTVFAAVENSDYSGVFGVTGEKATVCNLTVDGQIGSSVAGGIVGYNKGTILNCTNKALINTDNICGGICGKNEGTVLNCVNADIVFAKDAGGKIGGICGENIGGMIGNCINAGGIKTEGSYGGICAADSDGVIFNCYYDSTQYSAATDSEIFGITGLTAKEMKAESGEQGALIDRLNGYTERVRYPSGWLKWAKAEGNYPYLPYHVVCADAENGKVTVNNTTPLKYNLADYFAAGETVSLTVTPDEHYAIGSVKYNGTSATKADDGTYYFTMPEGYVTVTAEFYGLPHTHTDADGNVITFQPWTDSSSLPTEGSYYLTTDVHPNEGWTISKDVNLCLNGHVINLIKVDKTIHITDGATFSLYDCGTTEHKFYETKAQNFTYLPYWQIDLDGKYGTKTVTGGVITGAYNDWLHSDESISAILVENGTFNMYGGNICGNYCERESAGVVSVGSMGAGLDPFGGTFNMYGGAFCGNYGGSGCVNVIDSRMGGHFPEEQPQEQQGDKFIMYGGTFYENSGSYASAICVMTSISIFGGEIRNNLVSGSYASAVYTSFNETGTVTIGGSPVISENYSNDGLEINLKSLLREQPGAITFAEGEYAPKKGMHIGLSDKMYWELMIPIDDEMKPFYMSYLYSDDSSKYVKFDSENNMLVLASIEEGDHKINIETKGNGNVLYDHQYAKQEETVKIRVIPDSADDIVKSVKYNGQDATKQDDYYTFEMPDEDVTVSVEFGPAVTVIDVPTAKTGLVYNGEEQTGVAAGEGYTITDNVKTDAGNYTATATLEEGYAWADGSSEPAKINWSIAKVKVDVPTLAKDLYTFTGNEITAVADGDYYTVEGGSATAPGKYTATVTLDDTTNYEWKTAFEGKYVWYIANTEYYLTKAPTTTENGTYNQRAFYMDGDSKVIVKERMFYNDLTVDFAGWYLRTFVQCKPGDKEGSTDVRFISMLNGGSFDGTNLTDYEYAGFTVEIEGEEAFDVVTNIASTSFLADGKEIKISDYSNADDYFFLQNFVFGSEVPDDLPIKITPFVKLMDSGETISGKTVSFTIGILK